MQVEKHAISVTTDAAGAATAYTSLAVTGRILAIHYVKPSSGGFDNGSTITATLEATGEPIWAEANVNASAIRYPRVGVHDAVGVAATLDGTRLARDHVHAVNDRVKIVVASGGNTKAATINIIVG